MIETKAAFLERRLFSSQSELLENFLNCSDWLDKSRSSKKATFVLITSRLHNQNKSDFFGGPAFMQPIITI